MQILIVSATYFEIAPLAADLKFLSEKGPRLKGYEFHGKLVDILITGVGMVATSAWLSHTLAANKYDVVLNVGLCGSFDRKIKLGDVVRVSDDCLPELGAEDGDDFISIHKLKLQGENDFPFMRGKLFAAESEKFSPLNHLPAVSGITVNTVHGNDVSIAEIYARLNPAVESMEGAAVYYSALISGVPALQIRSVSNYVERRNRDAWDIALAVKNLNEAVVGFLRS